jgi:hypothetical protein
MDWKSFCRYWKKWKINGGGFAGIKESGIRRKK